MEGIIIQKKSITSIIIVNWNTGDLLLNCIESIYNHCDFEELEIIVVDNNSEDGSIQLVEDKFTETRMIKLNKNVGFAKANNIGYSEATGDYIFFLNPDTRLLEDSVSVMKSEIRNDPNVGAMGCKLLNNDFSLQESCRRLPNYIVYSFISLKLHHVYPNFKAYRNYLMKDFNYNESNQVEQIMGACMFVKRTTLEDVGLFDDDFWIWFEEVDLCNRILKRKWKVMYTPKTKIIHHKGQSFNQLMTLPRQKIFNNSMKYYFKKNHSTLEYNVIRCVSVVSIMVSVFINVIRNIFGASHKIRRS